MAVLVRSALLRLCPGAVPNPTASFLQLRRHLADGRNTQDADMAKAKKFVLVRHFQGEPKDTDFELRTEDLRPLQDGEVLAQAEFLSVDPYMRVYVLKKPTGNTMIGGQVARILQSKNSEWQVGDRIVADLGWRTHTVFDPSKADASVSRPFKLPDIGSLSPSLGLGVLGMPGNTAYFGLLEICKPKPGETVVVSGAAGAVGSIVGQIAKIKGCRVIGFAGTDEKASWLVNKMGFDAAFNYKTTTVREALKKAAPDGVDCYFDNVGGHFSSDVIYRMRHGGRIAVCGSISSYNAAKLTMVPILQPAIVTNELKMEGFVVTRWTDRWTEGILQNLQWIREDKIKFEETVTKGFENMPQAFMGMMRGENKGKALVAV